MASVRSHAAVLALGVTLLPAAADAAPEKKAADPQKVFNRKDANGDGSLSLDEFKAGMKPEVAEKADKRFKKIDGNGDGKLSFDEFKAGLPKPKNS
jgi:Ca2+-binding EF-hand superfamily protein